MKFYLAYQFSSVILILVNFSKSGSNISSNNIRNLKTSNTESSFSNIYLLMYCRIIQSLFAEDNLQLLQRTNKDTRLQPDPCPRPGLCLWLYLCPRPWVPFPIPVSFPLPVSLSLPLSLYLSVSVPVSLSPSLSLFSCHCRRLCFCPSLCDDVTVNVSVPVKVSVTLSLSVSVSVFLSMPRSLSLTLSVCLCPCSCPCSGL